MALRASNFLRSSPRVPLIPLCHLHTPRNLLILEERGLIQDIFPKEAGHDIAAVYCQPPRPAGRGKKDRPTPVHARAEKLGFEVRTPVSLKEEHAWQEVEPTVCRRRLND